MGRESLEITIEDLKTLAEINPLAWEQLLHIADARIANQEINRLKAENARLSGLHTEAEGLPEVLTTTENYGENGNIQPEIVAI